MSGLSSKHASLSQRAVFLLLAQVSPHLFAVKRHCSLTFTFFFLLSYLLYAFISPEAGDKLSCWPSTFCYNATCSLFLESLPEVGRAANLGGYFGSPCSAAIFPECKKHLSAACLKTAMGPTQVLVLF